MKHAMKIGITCYPTYGGSGAVATELGIELARRGHEVHFITYDSPFRLRGYSERVYLPSGRTRMGRYPLFDHYPYTLALASKQHEVVLREELDAAARALRHPPRDHRLSRARDAQGRAASSSVITTLHGTDITLVGQESSFYAITKFSIEQSDAVTAVSTYLRDETYRAFGCVQLRCPGDPQLRQPPRVPVRASRRLPRPVAPEGHKVITHVSNFREVKRVKDVVRVFARIRRAMPATLVMIGDGPERVDAENEARDLGVADDVRFLGPAGLGGLAAPGQRPVHPARHRPSRSGWRRSRRWRADRRWWRAGPAGCPRWSTTE